MNAGIPRRDTLLEILRGAQEREVERGDVDLPDLVPGGARRLGVRGAQGMAQVRAGRVGVALHDDDAFYGPP
jgi:hypothetical protein